MKDLTLVIMAAGMGSRFGGLKQIEPVGPNNEIIADYSVFDAIRAGFNKVVFIIRREHLEYFKEITKKYEGKIKVEFAYQELSEIPSNVILPNDRVKMLGTGHAIYCARELIDGDFVIINADDFYGLNSYEIAKKFFDENNNPNEFISVNYSYIVTASKVGKVKRGLVFERDGYVVETMESEIQNEDGKYIARSIEDDRVMEISENQPVSVNFFGLRQSFIPWLTEEFDKFIHGNIDLDSEFFLPEVIKNGINEGLFKLKGETSSSKWMGITYKDDLQDLKKNLNEMIERGEYPSKLWD